MMRDGDAAPKAENIEAQAAVWLRKQELADWNGGDDAALESWLSQSIHHSVAYWRLKAAWQRAECITAARDSGDIVPASRRPFWMFSSLIGVAAAVLMAIGLQLYRPADRVQSYSTDIGGHETVTFSDGTRIELNTNTSVRARMTTAERTIWLDSGEAYFHVKHDPAHPLTVIVAGHRVVDLGTDFLVRDDADYLEVALLQGRARVENLKPVKLSPPVTLLPGDVALATSDRMSVTRTAVKDLQDQLSWRRGVLVFYHTTLGDAVAELNRYNRLKLAIADPEIAQMRINGTFPSDDAALFGRVAQIVLKLHVENKGKEVVISR